MVTQHVIAVSVTELSTLNGSDGKFHVVSIVLQLKINSEIDLINNVNNYQCLPLCPLPGGSPRTVVSVHLPSTFGMSEPATCLLPDPLFCSGREETQPLLPAFPQVWGSAHLSHVSPTSSLLGDTSTDD